MPGSPIIPVRGLAEKGVLTDPSPYQLDLSAWSRAQNMRFHANAAETSAVFREAANMGSDAPAYVFPRRLSSDNTDQVVVVCENGQIRLFDSSGTSDVTDLSASLGTDPRAWTGTVLGDVIYVNRPDRNPEYLAPGGTRFAELPAWGTFGGTSHTVRARSLRAFGDQLVAMGISINGVEQGNLLWLSDLTLNGQTPGSWDFTDQTTNVVQTPLEQTTTPLVDGLAMRGVFVLYTASEIWAMQQTGTQSVISVSKLFGDGGMIAPNCAIEVQGKHYVFGTNDIYVHDGVQRVSIIDKRNRDKVFRYLDLAKTESCFVYYNEALRTVMFGYPTSDPDARFQMTPRCNFGAEYDIVSDTWTFVDLPNVCGMVTVFNTNSLTYGSAPAGLTYDTAGGSYFNLSPGPNPMCAVGSARGDAGGIIQTGRVMARDPYTNGRVVYPYVADANGSPVLERTGLDLDQIGADLAMAKVIRSIFPLVKSFNQGDTVTVEMGSAMFEGGPILWKPPQVFDPATNYKLDFNVSGRFLAVRFTPTVTPMDFGVAGFDLDFTTGGRR